MSNIEIGFLIALLACIIGGSWVVVEKKKKKEKTYTMCQSCGFPLKKDKKGGGTEKDGLLSKKYCSMCYMNGEFLFLPEIDNADKMQRFCIQEMKKSGMNGILAWLLTRQIPKLEKWRKQ